MSMQAYASAEDCKQNHYWGLDFGPDDTWEDGSPIVVPRPARGAEPQASAGGMVALDAEAFSKSAEMLEKHWRPQDSSR